MIEERCLGSFFPVGTTVNTFNSSILPVSCSFSITVSDRTPPILTCEDSLNVTVGSWVSFDIPTAWDSIDGPTNVFHVSGPLPDFVAEIDTQTVFASKDKSGNQGSCSINVTVVTTNQQIGLICPASQTLTTMSNARVVGYYALPAVSPSSAGWEIGLVQGPLSGSVFPLGTTLIIYRAVRQSVIQTCNFTMVVSLAGQASSCSGKCGKKIGNCWCDASCNKTNDCCPDQAQFCGPAPLTLASCAGVQLTFSSLVTHPV